MTQPVEHTHRSAAILRAQASIHLCEDALQQARERMDHREIVMLESLLWHRHAYLADLLAAAQPYEMSASATDTGRVHHASQ